MSLITDDSYLHLLLNGPLYLLPEPVMPPIVRKEDPVPAIDKAPLAETITPEVASPVPSNPLSVPKTPAVPASEAVPVSRSKVMLLYNEQTSSYLQPKHEKLLINILKSINLTLEDVELVNLHKIKPVDYVNILRAKTLNQFISFGIELSELEINVPLKAYQVTQIEGIAMLLADSFHELELNTDKKRLLWTCLKQMFLK